MHLASSEWSLDRRSDHRITLDTGYAVLVLRALSLAERDQIWIPAFERECGRAGVGASRVGKTKWKIKIGDYLLQDEEFGKGGFATVKQGIHKKRCVTVMRATGSALWCALLRATAFTLLVAIPCPVAVINGWQPKFSRSAICVILNFPTLRRRCGSAGSWQQGAFGGAGSKGAFGARGAPYSSYT